ncbi:MAG: TerD family protein [Muribaculaceae bacterium]|nr:TerD family protein [Muribaculaceae bacterium]
MGKFDLKKLGTGDRFSLNKSLGLSNIRVELSFSGEDLDVQAWLLNEDGLIVNDEGFVFYNSVNRTESFDKAKFGNKKNYLAQTRPMSADGSVLGAKDMQQGGLEVINVNLDKVAPEVNEIAISATVYEDGKTFGDVHEAKITVIDEDSDEALCEYQLSSDYINENACVAGRFILNDDGEWEFEAEGKAYEGGLGTLVEMFTEE